MDDSATSHAPPTLDQLSPVIAIRCDSLQPFMSSFISSLLNELGLGSRRTHTPQPQDESESRRSEQTNTPPNPNDPIVLGLNQSSGGFGSNSGDAGSFPGLPFFATLPKDMNGRTSEPEGTRPVPQNGLLPSQPIALPVGNQSGTAQETERRAGALGVTDSQHQHGNSTRPPDGSPSTTTVARVETGDDIERSPNNTLGVDDFGRPSLPADDGMGWLRKKIHAIRDLDLSNNEKARMVHDLMTESYNSTKVLSPDSSVALSTTLGPSNMNQAVVPPTPIMQQPSEPTPTSPTLSIPIPHTDTVFSLTAEDLQPTYVPRTEPESPVAEAGDEDPDTEELDEASLGCQHYMRNVKLQCYTCKKWYTCRFCHDQVENHHLIRRDTENMLCMLCAHPQPAASTCRQCGEQTAQYYCDICKLWDNDSKKSIYHCSDCGICRIGQGLGKDFFHCKVSCPGLAIISDGLDVL